MIEEGRRLKCDVCGKATAWIQKSNELVADDETIGWKSINLKGHSYMATKDYCSKECVINDLEEVYCTPTTE